jgi:hypothetical protein
MRADDPRAFCPTCRGELIGGSRFCGRCGTPQTFSARMGAVPPPPAPLHQPPLHQRPPAAPYQPPPHAWGSHGYGYPPPPSAVAPRPDRRGWKTALAVALIVLLVGGGAVAGILVARSGGGHRRSYLPCPGGVCPRFPIDELTRLEITDSAFGRVRLMVPPGALREPTELTARPAPPDLRPPRLADDAGGREPTLVGPIVDLGPDGQVFAQPLRVELPVDVAKVPAGAEVAVVTWDDARAERLAPVAHDREAGTVTVESRHFSRLAAIVDPGPQATFVVGPPPPPPCPPLERRAVKCPWTPDGYSVGECTPGFCWDGGPQGFLACKQLETAPGVARGENLNPYCPTGTPIWDRCTGVLTACAPPPP